MSREIDRREALREMGMAVGIVGALLLLDPPIRNIDNTLRVLGTLGGREADCSCRAEARSSEYPYDAIVVPGTSLIRTSSGFFEPDGDGKIRLEAAAIAYFQKQAPLIILLNGKNNAEKDPFAERTFLEDFYQKIAPDSPPIPREKIVLDGESINTATNMRELGKLLPGGKVLIATSDYHRDRAVLFACNYGLFADSLDAEETVSGFDPSLVRRHIDDPYKTVKEFLERVLLIWDPQGAVPTALIEVFGRI